MSKVYRGKVVTGDGIAGRDLGVPTANLDLGEIDLEPAVYAGYCDYGGERHRATVCYGVGEPMKFEVHLFDFDGELLGEELSVEIVEKVSELVPWSSVERMRQKILHDIQMANELFDELEGGESQNKA